MPIASRQAGSQKPENHCSTALLVRPGTTSSSFARGRPGPAIATIPVTNWVCWPRRAARNAVSSTPTATTPARRRGAVDQRCGVLADRAHHGAPAHAQSRRPRRCRGRPRPPAGRPPGGPGRSATPAGTPARTSRSTSTPGTPARRSHSRLSYSNVTGRPAHGGSRTRTGRRPCGLAATPQPAHQAAPAVVWIRLLELTVKLRHHQQQHPRQPEHGRAGTTVTVHLGPPRRVLDTAILRSQARTSGAGGDACRSHRPRSMTKSQFVSALVVEPLTAGRPSSFLPICTEQGRRRKTPAMDPSAHLELAHQHVVLVLQDVAVEDVLPREVGELDAHGQALPARDVDCLLPLTVRP